MKLGVAAIGVIIVIGGIFVRHVDDFLMKELVRLVLDRRSTGTYF